MLNGITGIWEFRLCPMGITGIWDFRFSGILGFLEFWVEILGAELAEWLHRLMGQSVL